MSREHPSHRRLAKVRLGVVLLAIAAVAGAGALLLVAGGPGGAPAVAAAAGSAPMPGMATPGPFAPNFGPGESNVVGPSDTPKVHPSSFPQPKNVGFHEFQANCSVNRVASDDPIVFPAQPGVSHSHTFTGASTDARSTTASLSAAPTSCTVPGDHSSWFPTMYKGDAPVLPKSTQVVYYKSGIKAYGTVRAFPRGLRFVVGSPKATKAEFQRDSGVSGWTCGSSGATYDFPASCPAHADLIVRYKAPSCWDGKHRDSPDHKSHMAYPIDGACPADHPVAVPMLEFKIAYPDTKDSADLRLASGRGYTWHADFFAAWDPKVQEALVTQCINGGGQCDARGYDAHQPRRGRVLDAQGRPIAQR